MSERIPVEAFPPGDFIRDEMEIRGMTIESLTAELRWIKPLTRAVLDGRYPTSPEFIAGSLARVFGTSVELWQNLQSSYDAWLTCRDCRP